MSDESMNFLRATIKADGRSPPRRLLLFWVVSPMSLGVSTTHQEQYEQTE